MKLSNKKISQNQELHAVYAVMDAEAISNGEFYCSGCGHGDRKLTHSHILSRKQHPELVCERANIVFDCATVGEGKGCHDIWEDKFPEELVMLKNLTYRLEYVMQHDDNLYWDLIEKINKHLDEKKQNINT
jgi:hypothetical protein